MLKYMYLTLKAIFSTGRFTWREPEEHWKVAHLKIAVYLVMTWWRKKTQDCEASLGGKAKSRNGWGNQAI